MQTVAAKQPDMAAQKQAHKRWQERLFFSSMAMASIVTVVTGFARSYYLKFYFQHPPLSPLLHLHGIVFSAWLLLFLMQTLLIAANHPRLHRRLGIVGGILFLLMIVVGISTAIIIAKQDLIRTGETYPLTFLVVPLGDVLVFSILCGAGFYYRRQLDIHKRLMLLAMISILPPAIARLPFTFLEAGPIAIYPLTDLFILACLLYDLISMRRINRATLVGGLLIIASQPLRLMVGETVGWLIFARWLINLVT